MIHKSTQYGSFTLANMPIEDNSFNLIYPLNFSPETDEADRVILWGPQGKKKLALLGPLSFKVHHPCFVVYDTPCNEAWLKRVGLWVDKTDTNWGPFG